MKYLIIFNFLISLCIICYLIYKRFPLYITVNKTFWYKKAYSITLWKIVSGSRKEGSYSAIGIFTLPFRNEKT